MTWQQQSGAAKRHAPATQRNRAPLLAVLRETLPRQGLALEVASGTGEHAAYFAPALAPLVWQPSDPNPELRASIAAHAAEAACETLRPPLDLDAGAADWPIAEADAVVCINMIHIAPWRAAEGLLAGAGRLLPAGGPLILYGPFVVAGETAESNRAFDASLKAQNPEWGLRALEEVAEAAGRHGLELTGTHAMPANNLSVVFRRTR
ncbi:MAG: DUF938 domain-containing protein [Rhodovibrionaceae bacterium]